MGVDGVVENGGGCGVCNVGVGVMWVWMMVK